MLALALCWLHSPPLAHSEESPITALVFSRDGESLIAGSDAGLRVYSWPELKLQRELSARTNSPGDLAFSSRGDRLAVGGGAPAEDGTLEILSWPAAESLELLTAHSDCVTSVQWLDQTTIAAASLDHDITVWQLPNREPASRMTGHSRGINALCYLPGAQVLVSAGIDQSLRVWKLGPNELQRSLNLHTQSITSLARQPGEHSIPLVASASEDKSVRFWQPTIGRMVRFTRLPSAPLDLEWLADGSTVAAACIDGHVRIIDPATAEVIQDLSAVEHWAYSLAVHPTDGSLAVGGANQELRRIVVEPLKN